MSMLFTIVVMLALFEFCEPADLGKSRNIEMRSVEKRECRDLTGYESCVNNCVGAQAICQRDCDRSYCH